MRSIKNTITEYPREQPELEDRCYNISLEINVCAKSPVEAAKKLQEWLRDTRINWQFYIQDDVTTDIYSVDLNEEDEDYIAIKINEYNPGIRPRTNGISNTSRKNNN
jgi:hypothetical protein